MTYEKFLTEVLSSIQTMLPAETEVSLRTIQKNNNCILDGLVFSTKDIQASPTIYLNAYYKNDFRNGVPIEAICRQVLAQYEKARLPEPIDTTFYSDFEKLKDQIIFRIVNRELNTDLLSEIPHMDYLDLSITFLALLSVQQTADATIQIRNSHLALWDVPTDTLFELAKKNTPRLLASDVRDLRDLLKEITLFLNRRKSPIRCMCSPTKSVCTAPDVSCMIICWRPCLKNSTTISISFLPVSTRYC